MPAMMRTRFAPSPNGTLHLGHAYSAMRTHDFVRAAGGEFLLRIEDIDGARSRTEFVDGIFHDLGWLGLAWDGEPLFQSRRLAEYHTAFERLRADGLIYPCFCTRSEIAVAQALRDIPGGPDGPVYPGTCRSLDCGRRQQLCATTPHCWRLDMAHAVKRAGPLSWRDLERGEIEAQPMAFGDIVVVRKDAPASYHLAATLDDAASGITHIVRGDDLFASTHVHRLLQALLGLPVPVYLHHPVILGPDGGKLSKSSQSPPLRDLREAGTDGPAVLAALRRGDLPAGHVLSPCPGPGQSLN